MPKNIIPYPNAKEWLALATIYAGSPAKLRLALVCAAEEIAWLRLELVRAGGEVTRRIDPDDLGKLWPESVSRESIRIPIMTPSSLD